MKPIDLKILDAKAIGAFALTKKTHELEIPIDPRIFPMNVIERAVSTLSEQIQEVNLEERSDFQWRLRLKLESELSAAEIEEFFYTKLICVSVVQQSLEATQDIQKLFLQSAHYVLTETQNAVGQQKLMPVSEFAFNAKASEIAPGFKVRMGFGSAQLLLETDRYPLPTVIETVHRLKSQCCCRVNARQSDVILVDIESLLKTEIQGQGQTNRDDFMWTLVKHFYKVLEAVKQERRNKSSYEFSNI